jgi:predicted RNase H-like HicB family nuclease
MLVPIDSSVQGGDQPMIAVSTPKHLRDAREHIEANSSAHCNSLRQVMLMRGEGGAWVAECPSLPGCYGQGKTRERAIESIKESIASHLCELESRGLPVPEERFDALIVAI